MNRPLQSLLRPAGLRRSLIPLTIVCGPPGAGKSHFVAENKGPGDKVIDLDDIAATLCRRERRIPLGPEMLTKALNRRNDWLRWLAEKPEAPAAWFIVTAADPAERAWWQRQLGGELIVIATPAALCIERIRVDPLRVLIADRQIAAVNDWWARNPHSAASAGAD
jgi:hypothetical protein